MLLKLSREKENKLRDVVIVGEEWEKLDAVLREDTLIVWPFVNKKENRLILLQIKGSIMEIDTKLMSLDVSDSEALQEFLDLINKKLPLKFRRRVIENSLKKTLLWYYQESQGIVGQMWGAMSSGGLAKAGI